MIAPAPATLAFLSTVRLPTPLVPSFAVTRSGRPSALKSSTATTRGFEPVSNGAGPAKLGAVAPFCVVLRSVVMPAEPDELRLADTRSGLPSRSKSADATVNGPLPAPNGADAVKVGGAAAAGAAQASSPPIAPAAASRPRPVHGPTLMCLRR